MKRNALTLFCILCVYSGFTYANQQVRDNRIKNVLHRLEVQGSVRLVNSNIVGVQASRDALRSLLIDIDRELQAGRQNGTEYETLLSVGQKLVDFTNRTEPSDVFNMDEIKQIRGIDQLAEELRSSLY